MPNDDKQGDSGEETSFGTLTFGALLVAAFPVAPLVAFLLLKSLPAPWLTWVSALWLFPSWLIACTLLSGAMMLPVTGVAWTLEWVLERVSATAREITERVSVLQSAFLAVFVFWSGSVAGGFLFILWKAARHNYS